MADPEPWRVYVGERFDTELDILAQPYADHPDFDPKWRL